MFFSNKLFTLNNKYYPAILPAIARQEMSQLIPRYQAKKHKSNKIKINNNKEVGITVT